MFDAVMSDDFGTLNKVLKEERVPVDIRCAPDACRRHATRIDGWHIDVCSSPSLHRLSVAPDMMLCEWPRSVVSVSGSRRLRAARGCVDTCSGPNGYTPLFQAMYSHKINSAHMLLEAGANPKLRNNQGFNALDASAYSGCVRCVEMLLQHGAVSVHMVGRDGYTAFHRAICARARPQQHARSCALILSSLHPRALRRAARDARRNLPFCPRERMGGACACGGPHSHSRRHVRNPSASLS